MPSARMRCIGSRMMSPRWHVRASEISDHQKKSQMRTVLSVNAENSCEARNMLRINGPIEKCQHCSVGRGDYCCHVKGAPRVPYGARMGPPLEPVSPNSREERKTQKASSYNQASSPIVERGQWAPAVRQQLGRNEASRYALLREGVRRWCLRGQRLIQDNGVGSAIVILLESDPRVSRYSCSGRKVACNKDQRRPKIVVVAKKKRR